MVRLTDRPDMTLDVYRGRKTTMQQQQPSNGAPYRGYGYVPLRFGANVVRRMGTQQQHRGQGKVQ